jgi:predicted porin
LFGIVDAGVGKYKANDGTSATKLTTSNLSSSQLGFRGVEDLGGGLKAGFWLEAGLTNDSGVGQASNTNNQASGQQAANGGLTFNRRSTLSLAGSFGEIRLGRDYTPEFWNKTVFDPFGTLGVGQATNLILTGTGAAGIRASNGVSYLFNVAANGGSHALGSQGLYAQVTSAQGENTSGTATSKDGNYTGARVGYAAGALNVAVATGTTKSAAVADFKVTNLGASYDLGVAKLIVDTNTNKTGDNTVNNKTNLIGAQIPVGAGYIPVSFISYKSTGSASNGFKADQFAIGYVHNLSKRTALYANYAKLDNKGGAKFNVTGAPAGAAANGTSSGYEAGLKHSF